MADTSDLSIDAPSDMNDFPDLNTELAPPPEVSYPDKASLIAAVQAHGKQHGYNIVIKTSSIPSEKKPGRIAKVWLRCDRGGTYRPRNGLTEENRKRKRTSRLMECPFMVIATGAPGMWSVKVHEPHHNHGPSMETPRANANHKVRKGQIAAVPYDWPHDASFSKFTTALVIVDMQRDFCSAGGFLEYQGYDITATLNLVPKLKRLLEAFRAGEFPVYHTREGHRPDLSTLSSRENHRSHNNALGLGVGAQGPLGRLLVRGEPGHDIVAELYPRPDEPVIDKPGRSAFAYTDFDLLLRNKGIKNLVVAGISTDVGVSSTLRDANERGYDCLLVEDGTAANEPNLHFSACESIKIEGGTFGVTGKLDDIIGAITAFKNANPKSASKTNQGLSSSLPDTPNTPATLMGPSMTTPLGGSMSMSAGSLGTPFMTGTVGMNGGSGSDMV